MPKKFVGEFSTVALISSTEKKWRRGGVSRFYVEKILTQSAENFRRESFTVALLSGTENIWRRGGGFSRFYVEKLLSDSAEKIRMEILYC